MDQKSNGIWILNPHYNYYGPEVQWNMDFKSTLYSVLHYFESYAFVSHRLIVFLIACVGSC